MAEDKLDAGTTPGRLSEFLRTRQREIVATWAERVRALSPARDLSTRALIDHLPTILDRIADGMEKAEEREPDPGPEPRYHALDRLARGFDLDEVVREYALLRRTLFDLWEAEAGQYIAIADLKSLDAALDEAVAESAVNFMQARARMLEALDRVSVAALGMADLDVFLRELLRVTLESTEGVDAAVVLLREDEHLVVRAVAGLDALHEGTRFRLAEGFAGKIANEGEPLAVRDAAIDPLVKSPLVRGSGLRALYGVPLRHRGQVIGVSYIGSRTAYEFSEEEQLLFRSMTNRATDAIVQAALVADVQRAARAAEFLSHASNMLSVSLDPEETFATIAELAVPHLGDWCAVDVLEEGRIRSAAVAHGDADKVAAARELRRRFPPPADAPRGVMNVLRTGHTEVYERITEDMLAESAVSPEHLEALHALGGLRSAIIAPMVVGDRTFGALTLAYAESGRHYTKEEVAVAEELARRAAVTLDNARHLREAQRAVRMREDILAIVSHDLRNPLSAVSMSAALLNRRLPNLEARDRNLIDAIQRSATRMDRLIDDLLDMASIEAERLALDVRPCELTGLLTEAQESYSHLATERGLALRADVDVEGVLVCCDPDRILQVLSNLLGNAIKFSPSGASIALRAHRMGSEVCIEVCDTGNGISPEQAPHIFQPYWSAKRRERKGIGLGLFISKGIVEAHHGRIWMHTKVGEGTTFSFTLPVAAEEERSE